MYEELLNLPEETGRLGTMVAISDLIHETERLEAARAAKEAELLELRAQTAELFGSALEAAGNDEGTVSAAKAMWERDPQTAAQAIAGCSIEEAVSAARGCNQYKHKPGCPEEGEEDRAADVNKNGFDEITGTLEKDRINGAKVRSSKANEVLRKIEKEEKKYEPGSMESRAWREALINAEAMASNIRSASRYIIENPSGKRMREAFEEGHNKLQELERLYHRTALGIKTREDVKASHEPSLEDMLVGDLVQAAGCNQYKHKPGCPEADENNPGEIKRNSGKRIVSRKIEKSFFFPTEDEARRFNIAKDTFLEELDPDGYLPETEYRNKKRYVVFGNLFIRNKESKGKMFTNLSDEDYRDLWNAENEVAGAYLDFNEHMTPDNLEAIMKREREYDKVRLKLEKKYLKD